MFCLQAIFHWPKQYLDVYQNIKAKDETFVTEINGIIHNN